MALSDPRLVFGIHSVTPYNRTTREPYGILKVLQGSTFSLTGELVTLNGGSFRFPWGIEDGNITAELSLTFNEYPDFLYNLFLGKSPTAASAEATGGISTLENISGTSLASATTGIASITATADEEDDLKFGKVLVKAVDATTVDLYYSSDVDFSRGVDGSFESDYLKINATPLTVTGTDGTTEVANYGLTITGGSGTVALVAGDTAIFEVRPINQKSSSVVIGGVSDVFPEFGAYIYAQQCGNGKMVELDVYRLKALGLPHNFNAKAFSEAEVTAQAYYDSSRSGVFSMRSIEAP